MKNYKSAIIINTLRCIVLLAIVTSVLSVKKDQPIIKLAFTIGIAACGMNDFLRIRFDHKKNSWPFNLSVLFSIIGSGFYYYRFHNAATSVYFIFPLAEIFVHSAVPYGFMIFHFFIYMVINYPYRNSSLSITVLAYSFIVVILFLFRNITIEKKKEQYLNDELKDANVKLKKYSDKVQQIAMAEERTRIAQELHDSIGHGLIALGMNLEFAESTIQTDPMKAEKAVRRAHEQSKKCMDDLRKAVTALKNYSVVKDLNLQNSLDMLFGQFQPERVNFQLSFDNQVEKEPLETKNCVYKTIREAITNGIQHGHAVFFDVSILEEKNKISVSVKDNGIGCNNIVKSNGLTGIEKRISSLGGNVNYSSTYKDGFCIKAIIPSAAQDKEENP